MATAAKSRTPGPGTDLNGQLFESQFGVTCMQGQGICKDRSKICNELSTASIELMDVE